MPDPNMYATEFPEKGNIEGFWWVKEISPGWNTHPNSTGSGNCTAIWAVRSPLTTRGRTLVFVEWKLSARLKTPHCVDFPWWARLKRVGWLPNSLLNSELTPRGEWYVSIKLYLLFVLLNTILWSMASSWLAFHVCQKLLALYIFCFLYLYINTLMSTL